MRSKKNGLLLSLIITSLLLIVGCDDDSSTPDMDFQYPLAIGSSWQYENNYTITFDSLATYNGLSDTTFYSSGTVAIIESTVIYDTLDVFNFETNINENGNIFTGNEYYNVNNNSLISYGYINPMMITPKVDQKYAYLKFKDRNFNNVKEIVEWVKKGISNNGCNKEDDITFDPVTSLDYPLEEDKQWVYRYETYDGEPWRIDKKILNWEEIEVSAGFFNCWRIRWYNNPFGSGNIWDEDIIQYDYIAEVGLIQRILEIINIECFDEENNFIGNMTWTEESSLNDYN